MTTLAALVLVCGCTGQPSTPAGAQPSSPAPPASPVSQPVEARSLLGKPLHRPVVDGPRRAKLEEDLAAARLAYQQQPDSEETCIWVGRRLAYLGRFNDAIAIYTNGLSVHPRSYRLLRHRGHRYITIRKFDLALADLTRAAELIKDTKDQPEPDGMPNAKGIPLTTDHSNVMYHLGLVQYLRGDFESAAETFGKCTAMATTDDTICSTTHWRYLSLRRAGKAKEAAAALEPIRPEMNIIENDGYWRLCLMYKGLATTAETLKPGETGAPDPAIAYGVAAFTILEGNEKLGTPLLQGAADSVSWPSFGVIAAEADIARAPKFPAGSGKK